MIGRKLDNDGDIVTSGEMWSRDRRNIAQTIKTRLKLFTGEYFRNNKEGVPWLFKEDGSEGILGKGYSLANVESIIRLRISQTEGVMKISSFKMNYDNKTRKLSISTSVVTKFGMREIVWES